MFNPQLRINYKAEGYSPIFSLSKSPEIADKWRRAICRQGAFELKSVYVCIKHFREEDIIRTFEIHQADGSMQPIALSKPKLIETAIPCVIPECPKYLSSTGNNPARLTYEYKEQELFDEAVRTSIAEQLAD